MKLRQRLDKVLPPSMLQNAPRKFEVVGDICVLKLRENLFPYASKIGEVLDMIKTGKIFTQEV